MVTESGSICIEEPSKPGAHILAGKLVAGVFAGLAVLAAQAQQSEPDGYAGATSANYQQAYASSQWDTRYESQLVTNTTQLITDGARSGEGYFSADGTQFVYQVEMPGNPFYQTRLPTAGWSHLIQIGFHQLKRKYLPLETQRFHRGSEG